MSERPRCGRCGHESRDHRVVFEDGFPIRLECLHPECAPSVNRPVSVCQEFKWERSGERPILTNATDRLEPRQDYPEWKAALERAMARFEAFLAKLRDDVARRDPRH